MGILSGILTFGLVLSSVLLILLILVQLPKKEAGGGLAFGGGASQAVLGAGAGSALTRLTRNLTIFFLTVALLNSVLVSRIHDGKGSAAIEEALETGGEDDVFDIDALISEESEGNEATNENNGGAAPDLSISSSEEVESQESEDAGNEGDSESVDPDPEGATPGEGAVEDETAEEDSDGSEAPSDSEASAEGEGVESEDSDVANPQR